MFAGTGTPTPAAIFRSTDGGTTWSQRPVDIAEECPAVGVPRITGFAIDPVNPKSIWAAIEVDGLRHSADGGDTWSRVGEEIPNMDLHNVAVVLGPPKRVFAVVNNDAYFSEDEGESWSSVGVGERFPLKYTRGFSASPANGKTVFFTIGDATPGMTGAVMRSDDTGTTWEAVPLPDQPNSAMWVVNLQAWDPEVVFAGSRYGYLYRSDDAGRSWARIRGNSARSHQYSGSRHSHRTSLFGDALFRARLRRAACWLTAAARGVAPGRATMSSARRRWGTSSARGWA